MASIEDNVQRCQWPGLADPVYQTYHDTEWGVPHADETALFEKLVLEGFQAGLSWLTILRKRQHFRAAFDGFDAERMARYGEHDMARLMADAGIVRNRLKIEAAILSARAYLKLRETTTLGSFLWALVDDPVRHGAWDRHSDIPTQTPTSQKMSKALKDLNFRFVGPTTTYAFMQSVGMVNDHLGSCHRHAPCAALQRAYHGNRINPTARGPRR